MKNVACVALSKHVVVHSQGLIRSFMVFTSNQVMVLSSPLVYNNSIFLNRILIPSSAMVTGEMIVTSNGEGPCNQPVLVSAQPWKSFENLQCIHATFQHLNASGTAFMATLSFKNLNYINK